MNLINIRTFLKIFETGSLVRASEALNVSQSTVTTRLHSLESELGQILVSRQRPNAELTAAGFRFKRHAELMINIWRLAKIETSLPAHIDSVFNFGCHLDLWPELGRKLVDHVYCGSPKTALSIWQGEQEELDKWLGNGLIDVALAYQPVVHQNQTAQCICSEKLVLYSTRLGSPMRFDPLYVYVHAGEDFARNHAAAYADADTARVNFASAVWAMEHLLENGGSAYLPQRLAKSRVARGQLHVVADAPVFARNVYLVTNSASAAGWPELLDLAKQLAQES